MAAPRFKEMVKLFVRFYNTKEVLKVMYTAIHSHYDGAWESFTKVPENVRKRWWNVVESTYYWEDRDGPLIKRNWKSKCSTHISDTFCRHRAKGTKPRWVSVEHWDTLMKKCKESPTFKHKSEVNKKNRASEGQDGVSNYAGGSKSTAEYDLEFEKEHGRRMSMEELLRETYTNKKTGEYNCKRVEICVERFRQLKRSWLETHETLSSEDENLLWLTASGGEKKGKVFGQGSRYRKGGYVLNPAALHPDPNPNPPLDLAASTSPSAPNALLPSPSFPDAAAQLVTSTTTSLPVPQPTLMMPPSGVLQPMTTTSPPFVAGASIDNSSIDQELSIWADKYRSLQNYQEGVRRMEQQMPFQALLSTSPSTQEFNSTFARFPFDSSTDPHLT